MKKFLKIFLAIIVILFTIFGSDYLICSESYADVVATQEIEPQLKEETEIRETIVEEPKVVYMGNFVATAYCKENYPHICNNGDATYTATMTTPTPGRTVAVDPYVIPLGSTVIINGHEHEYIAEDTGGAVKGNRVDILFETHEEAIQFGKQIVEVEVVY